MLLYTVPAVCTVLTYTLLWCVYTLFPGGIKSRHKARGFGVQLRKQILEGTLYLMLLCRAMQAEAVAETEERGTYLNPPGWGKTSMKEGLSLSPGWCPSVVSRCEKNISLEVGGNHWVKWLLDTGGRTRGQEKAESRAGGKALNPEGYGWWGRREAVKELLRGVRQWGTHGKRGMYI